MKKFLHISYVLVLVLMLGACEKLVTDVDLPKTKQELVVFSFISPEDTMVEVGVWQSQPLFTKSNGNIDEPIADAVVTISAIGGAVTTIPFDAFSGRYTINQNLFKIEAGVTYQIEVKHGDRIAKASTTVPDKASFVTEFTSQKLSNGTSADVPAYRHLLKWNATGLNYHRVALQNTYVNSIDTTYYTIEDVVTDASTVTLNDYNFSSSKRTLTAFLITADKAYYEYHLRRLNYFGDDPFSEPVQQYTNVNGGLGVFASYRKTKKVVEVD